MLNKIGIVVGCVLFIDIIFISRIKFVQAQSEYSIKLGYFTPPPSATNSPTDVPSDTPTTTPTLPENPIPSLIPTTTPTPILNISDANANLVKEFTNSIRVACPDNIVNLDNFTCIADIPIPINKREGVIWELDSSVQSFNWLQCVGFVRALSYLTRGEFMDNGGDAISFFTNIPSSYYLILNNANTRPPQPNDLAIWNDDTYGHIAYVLNAYDAFNFRIAEANYGAPGQVGFRNTTTDNPHLVGWIRRK